MAAVTVVTEVKTLAKLINGFGIFGSQLLINNRPDFYDQAKNNLRKCKIEHETALKALDEIAEKTQSEKPFLLIEDIFRYSRQDAIGCILLANRCLWACAFMAHLLANANKISNPLEDVRQHDPVLH